jgi:tetratricopeptide (TPR) repeat protein
MVQNPSENSENRQFKAIIGAVGSFLFAAALMFFLFNAYKVNPIASATLGLSAGAFVVFIIMGISGILKEFSIKSPLLEMTSILKERIVNVQNDLTESKKEIKEKIVDLNQSIQSINNTIKNMTISTSDAKSDAHQTTTTQINNNIGDLVKEVSKINTDIMSSKLKEFGFDINNPPPSKDLPQNVENDIKKLEKRQEKLESILEQLPVQTHFDMSDYMNRAYFLTIDKKYDEAIKLYDRILEKDPENVEALLRKGVAFHYSGRYDQAISTFNRVLDIDKNNVMALHWKGSSLWFSGKQDEANSFYDKALAIDPNFYLSLYLKACNKARDGHTDDALKLLKKAITANPKIISYAKNDPAFNNLKGDIRFRKLINPEERLIKV